MPVRTEKVHLRGIEDGGTEALARFLSKYDEKQCILLKYTFGLLNWTMLFRKKYNSWSQSSLVDSDFELIKEVVRETSRPEKIKRLAEKIVSNIKFEDLKEHKIAALHWRYDLHDWAAHKDDLEIMKKILAIRERPEYFAEFIEQELEKRNITRLVIFSPPRNGLILCKM